MKKFLVVKTLETDKEVHRIDVSDKVESQIEKAEMALLRNMDMEKFYVDLVETDDDTR